LVIIGILDFTLISCGKSNNPASRIRR